MATIEERARVFSEEQNGCDICDGKGRYCPCGNFTAEYDKYVKIATEQDRIARADERKKCIDEVCEFMYNFHLSNGVAPLYDYVGNVRKAMEGG